MTRKLPTSSRAGTFLSRLAKDSSGNTMMIVAASLLPLIAMIGSGVDMGRGYLVQTRLQHACDAGVLAARKRLGTEVAVTTVIPTAVNDIGQRFFNLNFDDGDFGTESRVFNMVLEADFAITGDASIVVPTTLMNVFGYTEMPVNVDCKAQINMPNTDVMMVLDTTGSMLETNPGDTVNRITALRSTVIAFHAELEANRSAATRIRYGFVPYSTNINVGHLLQPDWLVDEWSYNFREAHTTGGTYDVTTYEYDYPFIGGTWEAGTEYYGATCPTYNLAYTYGTPVVDGDGWTNTLVTINGTYGSCTQVDTGSYRIVPYVVTNYQYTSRSRPTGTLTYNNATWQYDKYDVNLAFLATTNFTAVPMGGNPSVPSDVNAYYRGCIEERDTYEINDYSNVDLGRALDLDLDLIPDPADADTQWRPMLNELSWLREMRSNGTGMFTPGRVTANEDFINAQWSGFSDCPSPASNLAVMDAAQVASYVNNLTVNGSTYHDIGMIWGGRLLSPTGLFATQNADVSASQPTSRHMIFLTDGNTAPLDVSYGTYGVEPLDRRRWRPTSSMTLTQTVEERFSYACQQVKNRNVTVWVISFGVAANPIMETCAGAGRYFVADDADELADIFSDIANRMAELRVTD